jgi:hypothetical protein
MKSYNTVNKTQIISWTVLWTQSNQWQIFLALNYGPVMDIIMSLTPVGLKIMRNIKHPFMDAGFRPELALLNS